MINKLPSEVCSGCGDVVVWACARCRRCPNCYHKPWCEGEFVHVYSGVPATGAVSGKLVSVLSSPSLIAQKEDVVAKEVEKRKGYGFKSWRVGSCTIVALMNGSGSEVEELSVVTAIKPQDLEDVIDLLQMIAGGKIDEVRQVREVSTAR